MPNSCTCALRAGLGQSFEQSLRMEFVDAGRDSAGLGYFQVAADFAGQNLVNFASQYSGQGPKNSGE
jgi:hypothetical protein